MKRRLNYRGGVTSDERVVRGKYRSFQSAITNRRGGTYQAENITFNGKIWRCLINPDKLKEDYDQKIISIDYEAGLHEGDVFYWNRTNSYWIVYLEEHCEEAYFRANIRRCNYQIGKYWVYLRGPVETALVWRQKHQIEFNDMNYSILFYIQKNEETKEMFKRFAKVKFDGHTWRVAATDAYSQPGIIEVYLEEFFDNQYEDAAGVVEIIEPDTTQPYIEGPRIVNGYDTEISYSIVGKTGGVFSIENNSKIKIGNITDSSCTVDILTGKSGEFKISYKVNGEDPISADVIIQSL